MEQYTRGTKTEKRNTASLERGDKVLTHPQPETDHSVVFASRKTGTDVREVADKVKVAPAPYGHQRRYVILFTDGTQSVPVAPIQTWHVVTGPPVRGLEQLLP